MSRQSRQILRELRPTRYILGLVTDEARGTFRGKVIIDLRKNGRPSQRITLHQQGLKADYAHIVKHDKKGDKTLSVARTNNQDSFEELRLHTNEQVYSGTYTVTVGFNGKLTKTLAESMTHLSQDLPKLFESSQARVIFPCIDEPGAAGTFELILRPIDELNGTMLDD